MRELTIDWAALHSAFQMNMPEVRCFLAVEDGRVLKLPPGDPSLSAVRGDPNRFIAIEAVPSRIQYQWLADFIGTVGEGEARTRMEAAINGKGAFRRFKDILLTLPDERRRWFEYRDQMMRHRIVEWIREQGIAPSNEAPWSPDEVYNPGLIEDAQPAQLLAQSAAKSSMAVAGFAPMSHTLERVPPVAATPENLGNIAAGPESKSFGRSVAVRNNQHEIEALRDFLIEWSDTRTQETLPGPLELESLATEIGKHFHVKSAHA